MTELNINQAKMVTKVCSKCKKEVSIDQFNKGQNRDGYQSYCKPCNRETNKLSKLRNGNENWHQDGYASEKEHFNAAIKHYAELFNLPSLTRHIRK